MVSIMEIMQLCRLCLVKEQVNIPIFEDQGDIRQIFLKITACLPVKLAKEDKLPKKICDGCLYKLELLYQFWNSTANAEKQLLSWIEESNMDLNSKPTEEVATNSQPQEHTVKQEKIEPAESTNENADLSTEAQSYILQQQQLAYQAEFPFKESQGSNAEGGDAPDDSEEPLPKRRRRQLRRQATKPIPPESLDSSDNEAADSFLEMAVTKTEEESESDGDENVDDPEPAKYVAVSSEDREQPGPSGLGKGNTDAPSDQSELEEDIQLTGYECELCSQVFPSKKDFLSHHMKDGSTDLICCNCGMIFNTTTDLFEHQQTHKMDQVVIEQADIQFTEYSEDVQAVLNIPSEESAIGSTSELLYILDDSQCVNEVIIEETENQHKSNKQDSFSIVQVDHGYMIPSVFKGQLETRKRMKKKNTASDSDEAESNDLLVSIKPSTSKRITTSKIRQFPIRKHHELPDFTASDYVVLNPNDEVDIVHYKCLRCEQLFINKFVFFRHIEKGKCYINSCDVCSADFEKNSDFYEHYIVEHTDRAICNFCFRTFMYEKNVKEHMLRHLDQFRHRCEECNKGFYTVREYRNHYKNRHMGIRHRCDECGRSFADEYYFKRHIATHIKKTIDTQSS